MTLGVETRSRDHVNTYDCALKYVITKDRIAERLHDFTGTVNRGASPPRPLTGQKRG